MKTKVKTESKFIVKPENKVVVCNMSVDMQLMDSECWNHMDPAWWATKAPKVNQFGEFTVTAIARCNSKDTFDETLGKRIAESRAKAKAFKISAKVYDCIKKGLIEITKDVHLRQLACANEEEIENNHVSKLVK